MITEDEPHEKALVRSESHQLTKRSSALVRRALESPLTQKAMSNSIGMEFVFIPPGRFEMGSNNICPDEKPVHHVTVRQSFLMGKYEVTQGQWQAVMGSDPSYFKGDDNLPVESVSWDDAQDFLNELNEVNDRYRYRLPTEAEWEYACRAGTNREYHAHDVDVIGWHLDNSGQKTHRVGDKRPNAFGLYDMLGNVKEWCHDWYVDTYEGAPSDGSARISDGKQEERVLRGASWISDAWFLRSAFRTHGAPDSRHYSAGFRVVAIVRTP